MKLSQKMIKHIETLHTMSRQGIFETYDEMIPDVDSNDTDQIKLELAYLIYFVLHNKEPNEIQRDMIYCYFQKLEMNESLKTYSHSQSTQRTIKKLYRMIGVR